MKRKFLLIVLLCLAWIPQMAALRHQDQEDSGGALPLPKCQSQETEIPYYDDYYGYTSRSEYTLLCSNVVLTAGQPLNVIYNNPSSIKSITFKDSTIPLISVGVFMAFKNLSELYLNGSLVSSIHPGAFTGLIKLEKLYLQDNNISKMSRGILNSLPNLNILNLSNNSMELIEENAFLGLFSLKKLYLNNNKLKLLTSSTFHKLNNLNVIDLSYNLLTDIPLNLFSGLAFYSNFSFVALSNNNFTTIDFSVFPETLKYLTLQNNRISSIENWSHLQGILNTDLSNKAPRNIDTLDETLLHFNLSRNITEELINSFLNQSKNMMILDLSRNLLKNISVDTFVGLAHLTDLYLENNQINIIPIGCFRNLQSLRLLNISNNEIAEFEYGTFSGLSALKIFDISSNKLAHIYESSFYDLKNLLVLNINDNLITSFDPHNLTDYSKKLKTVALNNNPWVCKTLLNIVRTLENNNVTVVQGSIQETAHVHGIGCLNNDFKDTTVPFSPHCEKEIENASLEKLYAISSEMNAYKKFFDKDFLNSSFYKYFENFTKLNSAPNVNDSVSLLLNHFNDGFKNTTFYKYFERDSSNNSVFGRFDTVFQKLSKALRSFDVDLNNSTLYKVVHSDKLGQNLSKYFDDGFKNSSFYKYFSKEFSNSDFFDKALQTRADSNLLRIRNYFDQDFKNSTFFSLLGRDHANHFNSNFIDYSDLNANVGRLTDNTPHISKDDILSKISELTDTIKAQEDAMKSARTGSAVFMTIVVTMLLAITYLLAFNHIRTRFKRNICKPVSENTIEAQMHIPDAEIELM